MCNRTLVLALGNPLRGDDGVGVEVLKKIALTLDPSPAGEGQSKAASTFDPPSPSGAIGRRGEGMRACDVTLMDGGTAGLETVLLMQDYQRVIIIDAAEMGKIPGEWVCFRPDEVRLMARDLSSRVTVHYAGLSEALALGDALGLLPPEIVIYGVQPAEIGWEAGLSPAVAAVVDEIAQAVVEQLEKAL